MKRKEFLGFALMLAAARHLPLGKFQEEEINFNFSVLKSYLDKIPAPERQTALLLTRNLVFDMEYIFQKADQKTDQVTLKRLIQEADKKFYAANKLTGVEFEYKPLTELSLEELKRDSKIPSENFEAMIRTMKAQIQKLKRMQDKLEDVLKAIMEVQEKMKEAVENEECAKTLSVITAVIIVVIAIVVAVFSFGAGGLLLAQELNKAAFELGSAILSPRGNLLKEGVININSRGVRIDMNGKNIFRSGDKLPIAEVDEQIRCGLIMMSRVVAKHFFTSKTYPRVSLVGELAYNIVGNTWKIKDFKSPC